nr:hypothetical protein [Lachnospiraceae bacterium]
MYSKKQRIAALVGIIFLVALYILTLISAIFRFPGSQKLFFICLFATIAVPILIWLYVWLYGKLTDKKTFADFSNLEEDTTGTSEQDDKTV